MTPALRKAFEQHRTERAEELFEIADILDRERLTPNSEPIRRAASQCKAGFRKDDAREYWGFDIADLHINLENQRHLRPRSAVMDQCAGVLSVTVEEYVPDAEEAVGRSYELLRQANVDFHLDAYQDIAGEIHNVRAAWHLDTHLYANESDHGVHPRFHFQVGGEGLDAIDADIRGILMPEAPRLACAPFDGILAVDFVLAHYCGDQWSLLKDLMPSYLRLRKSPIQRYWLPYFRTLAEGIGNLDAVPGGGDAHALLPNIFCGE
jgi:hypothetical protein